ncbi:uncharacterized protein LOC103383911 [Cynoglossus semilaevis]|uniref:uncharacterized protein LOC103383911 n=1 Tax=Cynoglossus semilaevis TaxID=244447 RepID=UPI0004966C00|nr:uncharacterized protein LOC103383911 [Cynoglossus semilaevis]
MSHQNTTMDVESLHKSDRRGRSYHDVFVVMSIIFLFVTVAAMAAAGILFAVNLRSKVSPSALTFDMSDRQPAFPQYKIDKFAYLEAKTVELVTSTMHWHQVFYGPTVSVGSNFLFDQAQQSLKPQREGMYFMYIDLNITCTFRCNAGLLTITVGDHLTCQLTLPDMANSTAVHQKCWTVTKLNTEGLLVQMTVPKDGLQHWKLNTKGSGFGIFLVD